jgi:hypothetical protein
MPHAARARKGHSMGSGIKKLTSRKAMRVATVFTGTAACATAFVPAANAQTARYAAPQAAMQPDTRWASRGCAGVPEWFHLYSLYGPKCLGGEGSIGGEMEVSGFCGGNNHGWWSGYNTQSPSIKYTRQHFAPGTNVYWFAGNTRKFPGGLVNVSKVTISNFNGHDTCPLSPTFPY